MKKSSIIGVSILSIFILCSLSYQPIIADTPIEQIVQVEESKASDLDVDELKELYTKLLELKSQSDCRCGDTTGWGFPVICTILYILSELSLRFGMGPGPPPLYMLVNIIAISIFHCEWVYPS